MRGFKKEMKLLPVCPLQVAEPRTAAADTLTDTKLEVSSVLM